MLLIASTFAGIYKNVISNCHNYFPAEKTKQNNFFFFFCNIVADLLLVRGGLPTITGLPGGLHHLVSILSINLDE